MASTNIQIFNEAQNNTLSDNNYRESEERTQGFLGKIAKANLFNKFCYQVSLVCKAIANFMVGRGYNANDTDPEEFSNNFRDSIISAITEQINARVPNLRSKETTYKKCDVVTDLCIPPWAELECIQAGTTSDLDLSDLLASYPYVTDLNAKVFNAIGFQIQDGTVIWVLRAKRFSSPKGTPIPFNGSFVTHTVSESGITKKYYVPKHPELGVEMLDYRFCDGQNVGGFSTINMTNRFLMCRSSATAGNGNGGADTIKLQTAHLPTNKFKLTLTCNNWNKKFSLEGTFKTTNEDKTHTHNAGFAVLCAEKGQGNQYGVRTIAGDDLPTTGASTPHTHQVKVIFKDINITHGHGISGTVQLNSSSQQTFSVVSQHYKIAYIQRIY